MVQVHDGPLTPGPFPMIMPLIGGNPSWKCLEMSEYVKKWLEVYEM